MGAEGLERPEAGRLSRRVVDGPCEREPRGRVAHRAGVRSEPAIDSSCRASERCWRAGRWSRLSRGATSDLTKLGLAGTMRRVGFQPHDGRIFDVLTGRGGVLVAIHSEPRAADALAILHSYGGGNAAIGAWTGRV